MKRIVIFALALLTTVSCQFNFLKNIVSGDGIPVETPFPVTDFSSISSAGSMDIHYTQTPGAYSATLTSDSNLAEFYDVKSENGTLSTRVQKGVIVRPETKTFLTANSSALEAIKVSGSGDCEINGDLVVNTDFEFCLSGSGDLEAGGVIKCNKFSSEVLGSGGIEVGSILADGADFSISGSGNVDVYSISAKSITVSIAGSGNVTLVCLDAGDIDIKITGSGNVRLTGNARSLNTKITGSGRVNSKGLVYPANTTSDGAE